MMTPNRIRQEIIKLIKDLFEVDLAIDSNPPVAQHLGNNVATITWARCVPSTDLVFTTINEYRWLVQNRQYSLVLFDGSLLQISYKFQRRKLIEHRLCFYPCPFYLDPEEWEIYQEMGFGLLDILEDFNFREFQDHLRLQSPIRFDYDLKSAKEDHPASHAHLLRENCRIPVFAPLSIGHFVQFVFRNFYTEQWQRSEFLHSWPCQQFDRTITTEQERQLHLSCV